MANQSPDRREVLAMLARVAALSQFPGFSRWVCAAAEPPPARSAAYQPQFFSPAEYQTIDHLAELILPADDSPGARDAGVPEFIDFMVAHDEDIQYKFRTGLAWLNAFATETYGQNFSSLAASQQEALLGKLAYRNQQAPTEIQGQEFFKLAREYTVMGYYTSRVGLEEIDNPGLRLYSSSPECPHKDDPEHRHLPPARY
jgi:hypothetical protein